MDANLGAQIDLGFEELVLFSSERVYGFLNRLLGDEQRTLQALDRFCSIAVQRFSRLRATDDFAQQVFACAVAAAEETKRLADSEETEAAPAADRILLGQEERKEAAEFLQLLPFEYRLVFLLRDSEGFDCAEVAAITGLSLEDTRGLAHRARLMMRRVFFRETGAEAKEMIITSTGAAERQALV